MFLTTQKLSERFQGNLKHTDQIDLAVAWATSGTALQLLERWKKGHPKRIRAMVGTCGNATEPDALERLANIGELRLVEGDGMLFHPKVYIFRGKSLIAWVGSANLTEGGFKNNEEAVLETKKGQGILHWFEERWKECNELQPDDINNYRARWKQKPPQKEFSDITAGRNIVTITNTMTIKVPKGEVFVPRGGNLPEKRVSREVAMQALESKECQTRSESRMGHTVFTLCAEGVKKRSRVPSNKELREMVPKSITDKQLAGRASKFRRKFNQTVTKLIS